MRASLLALAICAVVNPFTAFASECKVGTSALWVESETLNKDIRTQLLVRLEGRSPLSLEEIRKRYGLNLVSVGLTHSPMHIRDRPVSLSRSGVSDDSDAQVCLTFERLNPGSSRVIRSVTSVAGRDPQVCISKDGKVAATFIMELENTPMHHDFNAVLTVRDLNVGGEIALIDTSKGGCSR